MRVLIASDALAGLSAQAASEAMAHAFDRAGAQVAVVGLGVEGAELRRAVNSADPHASFVVAATPHDLVEALSRAPERARLVVDLTRFEADDLGRSVVEGFGADPASGLAALRAAWAGRDLVALVPAEERDRPLTGLTGLGSTLGRAAGRDLSDVLAADGVAGRWATQLGLEPGPGAGAAHGVGLILLAAGARLEDPLSYLSDAYGLAATVARADLVVTGAELLDFHAVGGPIVRHMVDLAGAALRPVVAVVGRNFVSARELRLAGLEAAYPVLEGPGDEPASPEALADVAARVAATWTWR